MKKIVSMIMMIMVLCMASVCFAREDVWVYGYEKGDFYVDKDSVHGFSDEFTLDLYYQGRDGSNHFIVGYFTSGDGTMTQVLNDRRQFISGGLLKPYEPGPVTNAYTYAIGLIEANGGRR